MHVALRVVEQAVVVEKPGAHTEQGVHAVEPAAAHDTPATHEVQTVLLLATQACVAALPATQVEHVLHGA